MLQSGKGLISGLISKLIVSPCTSLFPFFLFSSFLFISPFFPRNLLFPSLRFFYLHSLSVLYMFFPFPLFPSLPPLLPPPSLAFLHPNPFLLPLLLPLLTLPFILSSPPSQPETMIVLSTGSLHSIGERCLITASSTPPQLILLCWPAQLILRFAVPKIWF